MKLRTQILSLGLAGALLAGTVGAISLFTTSVLAGSINDSILAGQALQASQEADMMHDAIRGDAQLAQLGALQNAPQRITEAADGLASHVKTFDEALDTLDHLPLSTQSREALAATRPVVKSYFAAADHAVKSAHAGAAVDPKLQAEFQGAFTHLEGRMSALSDSIRKGGEALTEGAAASVAYARAVTVAALVLATLGIVVFALWLSRRMAQTMLQAVHAADHLARGELTSDIRPAGNDETAQLLRSMAAMQRSFAQIVRGVKANAESVATASAQIAQGNQDLSSRTEQQASALQQTAATMEQLGETVRNNADNAGQANRLAQDASTVAVQGGEVVNRVVTTMQAINDSSRKISDIIGVIDGIAFQTNILALNAAVEAARAGEQGRGFAVVASEVRSLAQRSAEAAREIKSLIGRSVDQVEQGTGLVDEAGKTMGAIVQSIRRVTEIVAEIATASGEQSTGVQEVGNTVRVMDNATQQNAALVEQSAAAAASLKVQALQLLQSVAVFRLDEGSALATGAPAR